MENSNTNNPYIYYNTIRIRQIMRLSKTTIEFILGMDNNSKFLMDMNYNNLGETSSLLLEVIENKVKSSIEKKFIK